MLLVCIQYCMLVHVVHCRPSYFMSMVHCVCASELCIFVNVSLLLDINKPTSSYLLFCEALIPSVFIFSFVSLHLSFSPYLFSPSLFSFLFLPLFLISFLPPSLPLSPSLPPFRKKRSAPVTITGAKERQYWAKGTGFGTGSTSSAWDMEAMLTKQQSEELLVSICFSALAGYLCWPSTPDAEQSEARLPASVMELLSESCLLPALASYLINDSGMFPRDQCKIDEYNN